MNKRWILLLGVPLVLLALSRSMLYSFSKAYRLELTVITDKADEYVFVTELDEREFKKLENNPSQEILPYLIQARKDYADKIGYRKEIYGAENYKMVTIRHNSFVVREIISGRVIIKKG